MKKHRHAAFGFLLIVTVVVVASLPSGVQGGTLPNTGWWNSLYVQNLGTEAATITSTAYRVFGATPYASTYRAYLPDVNPVPAGESVLFRAHDFMGWATAWGGPPTPSPFGTMPSDFQGGLSALADQPTRYLVELTNRPDTPYGISGGLAVGQYEGYAATDEHYSLFFPMVKRNSGGKSSTLFIQYLGTSPSDVYVWFWCPALSDPPVTTHTYYASQVRLGNVLAISPADNSVIDPDIPNNKVCSAQAWNNGTAKMVGLYTEYYTTEATTPSLIQTARAPSGASGIDTTLYAPYFKNKYPNPTSSTDRSTGFVVMNLSGSTTTIRGIFRCGSTNYNVDVSNVYPNMTATFVHPTGVPTDCLGTAKFTTPWGGVSLAGMSSEAFLDPVASAGYQQATTIPLVPYSAGSATIYVPAYKEVYDGRTSTIYIRNIGWTTAQVRLVFRDTASSSTWTMANTESIGIDGMQTYQVMSAKGAGYWQEGNPMPTGKLLAVTVLSTYASVPLIVAVEEASYSGDGFCWGQYVCLDRAMYLGFK